MFNLLILSIVLIIVAIFFIIFSIRQLRKSHDIKVQKKVQQQQIDKIKKEIALLQQSKQQKKQQLQSLTDIIKDNESKLQDHYKINIQLTNNKIEQYKKVVQQAANNYIDTIQKDYEDAEAVHKKKITQLQVAFNAAAADLKKLQDTRKAAYEALLKQKQIKQNKENYKLSPSKKDLQDIYTLNNIKANLHKPRILSMLIWQTYWQPLAKKQFPIISKDKTKIGIYKITNTITDECYIGQSLDVYKRWCQHCKAGLGIDTPVGNKLYKAIQTQGLQNFTFELLCECPKEELNQKEKYFIKLYQADTYGYNSTIGNKNK